MILTRNSDFFITLWWLLFFLKLTSSLAFLLVWNFTMVQWIYRIITSCFKINSTVFPKSIDWNSSYPINGKKKSHTYFTSICLVLSPSYFCLTPLLIVLMIWRQLILLEKDRMEKKKWIIFTFWVLFYSFIESCTNLLQNFPLIILKVFNCRLNHLKVNKLI